MTALPSTFQERPCQESQLPTCASATKSSTSPLEFDRQHQARIVGHVVELQCELVQPVEPCRIDAPPHGAGFAVVEIAALEEVYRPATSEGIA